MQLHVIIVVIVWTCWKDYASQTLMQVQATDEIVDDLTTNLITTAESSSANHQDQFCTTQSCNNFAKTYLSSLDTKSYPCNDFYNFVCRNTKKSLRTSLINNVKNNLKSMVVGHGNVKRVESKNLSRLRKLYASCKNKNAKNFYTLLNLIEQLGGFPLGGKRSGWDEKIPFDWIQLTGKFRDHGLEINQFLRFDMKRTFGRYHLRIEVPDRSFKEIDRVLYEEVINALYPETGIDISSQLIELSHFRKRMGEILSLAESSVKPPEVRIPEIDWHRLISGITHDPFADYYAQEYGRISSIAKILKDTNPNVLANHMIVTVIESLVSFVTNPKTGGLLYNGAGEPKCEKLLEDHMGIALSMEYYNHYVTLGSIKATWDIIDLLKTELKLMIDQAEWISTQKARSDAKAIIDGLKFDVGLQEELANDPRMGEWFYNGLKLDDKDVINNFMNINKVKYDLKFQQLSNKPIEGYEWLEYDYTPNVVVNAFYMKDLNRIKIPASIMNPLFVDESRLASINYGILGFTIAHEMIHSLEDLSMDNISKLRYKLKREHILLQYKDLTAEGAEGILDGRSTLLENIPDNAGIVIVYRAFRRWLRNHKHEPARLTGIELDPIQLFWASFATRWCLDNPKNTIKYDTHSPPIFRVNIPLSNYEKFAKDFRCPAGSKMNPDDRCTIC